MAVPVASCNVPVNSVDLSANVMTASVTLGTRDQSREGSRDCRGRPPSRTQVATRPSPQRTARLPAVRRHCRVHRTGQGWFRVANIVREARP